MPITKDQKIIYKIQNDKNFVNIKRFNFSLEQLIKHYPNGASTRVIAQSLNIEQEKVEELYNSIILKLKTLMGVSNV